MGYIHDLEHDCSIVNNTGVQICSSIAQYPYSSAWDMKYTFSNLSSADILHIII